MKPVDARSQEAVRRGLSKSALCLLLALAALPAAAEQQYAVTRIKVAGGGNPVAGVEDGVLFSQSFDSDCQLIAGETGTFSAALKSSVDLEVTVAGCPRAPMRPDVDCAWVVQKKKQFDSSCRQFENPPRFGQKKWRGRKGKLTVASPIATGEYELLLGCRIEDQPATLAEAPAAEDQALDEITEETAATDLRKALLSLPVHTTFYVTFGKPSEVFSPPEVDWYERATCWGAGLHPRNTEADALAAVLGGMYRYGQENWRYGYASPQDPGDDGEVDSYLFPLFESDSGSSKVEYMIEDEALRPTCFPPCKCTWKGLVAEDSPCNFADCYVFSDVLQGISGVLGVGGLLPLYIAGEAQVGFVTQPGSSLDPAFERSITCADEHETCYPYYFSSHSLRSRDGIVYDATFDKIYSTPGESIGLSRAKSTSEFMIFVNSSRSLLSLGKGYGGWGFYFDPPGRGSKARMPAMPAGRSIQFTGDVTFSTTKSSIEGIHSNVVAEIGVEILLPGQYLIHGELVADGQPVARRSWWSASMPSTALAAGPPGVTKVKLKFSGQEILESGVDGPWEMVALAAVRPDEVERVSAETPAWEHQSFGEKSAGIEEAIEARADGGDLAITVPLYVQAADTFGVEARLSSGVTIGYAGARQALETGSRSVRLEIPGEEIAASGLDGPWDLTVVLYGSDHKAIDNARTVVDGLEAASFE